MKKKLTAIFMIGIMALTLSACNVSVDNIDWAGLEEEISAWSSALMEASAEASPDTVKLRIISTSDVHGKFLPYDYALNAPDTSGSLAQISTALKDFRDENTILVDVGDSIQGNSSDLFLEDPVHPVVKSQNLMNYDVWVVGNHEFNYGVPVLKNIITQQKSHVLCGNVYNQDGSRLSDPYMILEKSGVKIGIIGMVSPVITRWDRANLADAGMKVTDPGEEIEKAISELKDQTDILIAACHMDLENEYDMENSGVLEIADRFPELDLILAAHGHEKIEGIEENGVLITENGDQGKTLSLIDLTMEKNPDGSYRRTGREFQLIEAADYEPDPALTGDEEIADADRRAKEDAVTLIGRLTNQSLAPEDDIPGITQARIEDTALVHLLNDVLQYYSGADITAVSVYNDDENLFQGDIRKCDLSQLYKYSNTLYKMRMTGRQLKQWMEWSARYFNTFQDGDLTISFNPDVRSYLYDIFGGVRYEIDISEPPGSRIKNITLPDGSPLDPDGEYLVATNNYRANTQLLAYGDIYSEEDGLPELLEKDIKGELGGIRELIGDYIQHVKGVPASDGLVDFTAEEVTPENACWKLTGYSWDEAQHQRVAELVRSGAISIPVSEDGRDKNIRSLTQEDLASAEASAAGREISEAEAYLSGPWGETQSLSVAVDTAGVPFSPPPEDLFPETQEAVSLVTYRYLEGVAEALYALDGKELRVRKSDRFAGQELFGDQPDASGEWEETTLSPSVRCLGTQGRIYRAFFDIGTDHAAIMFIPGPGGDGLTEEELQTLISSFE